MSIWPRTTPVGIYASKMPGFDFLNPPKGGSPDKPVIFPEVDPLGTEGKYDEGWRTIIEHPRRSEIEMVWIWYWNSYWEVAYIEPDAGIGAYAVGDLYIRKTAHYANLFRSGLPFEPFDEADEFSRYIGDVDHTDLKLRSAAEKDELLRDILRQSIGMVAKYTGREVNAENIANLDTAINSLVARVNQLERDGS